MRFIVSLGLALALAPAASALDMVALGVGATANQIVRFDTATPQTIEGPTPVANLGAFTLVGLDRRPATGEVVAVGTNGNQVQLFVLNLTTAEATPIGSAASVTVAGATAFGADFNPVTDRLRVVNNLASDGAGGNANNFRMDPNTGALSGVDTDLDFLGLPGAGTNAPAVAIAHTNNSPGASNTLPIGILAGGDRVVGHSGASPSLATLANIGLLDIDTSPNAAFDIGGEPEQGFAILENGGVSSLFLIDLLTGHATGVATVGTGSIDFGAVTIVGAASLVTTSRIACGDSPSAAALTAAGAIVTPDAPGDAAVCPALCKKWIGACKGIVSSVRACWKGVGGRVAKVRAGDCNTLASDERAACAGALADHKAELKVFLEDEAAAGSAYCDADGLAACLLDCG